MSVKKKYKKNTSNYESNKNKQDQNMLSVKVNKLTPKEINMIEIINENMPRLISSLKSQQ